MISGSTVLAVANKITEAAVQTSFIIWMIAKISIQFTDVIYVKDCVMTAAEILYMKSE
jgi:hypothetical protein